MKRIESSSGSLLRCAKEFAFSVFHLFIVPIFRSSTHLRWPTPQETSSENEKDLFMFKPKTLMTSWPCHDHLCTYAFMSCHWNRAFSCSSLNMGIKRHPCFLLFSLVTKLASKGVFFRSRTHAQWTLQQYHSWHGPCVRKQWAKMNHTWNEIVLCGTTLDRFIPKVELKYRNESMFIWCNG